jgi:hypothetical protein
MFKLSNMRLKVLIDIEILTGGGLDHHPKYLYTYRGGPQVLSRCQAIGHVEGQE